MSHLLALTSALFLLCLNRSVAQPPVTEGSKIFRTRCFVCHGLDGSGHGPSSTNLGADPRNFTDPDWQARTTDDRITQAIRGGGPSIGESAAMPPNPDLSASQVRALLEFIRSLRR
jgi:mono/diheme cytochrome c family protein